MNENIKWFNQNLLIFKDKVYGTDGLLKLSVVTNTENYGYFNSPMLNISVSNNFQKMVSLNIQNAEDLQESFEQALKQLNGHDVVIEKKYNLNTKLYFRFSVDQNQNQRVVVIELISNETDATKIIVPIKPIFQSFLRRLRKYVENYDQICFNLLNNSINHECIEVIKQLPMLIKGISSQIISTETILDTRAPELPSEDFSQTELTMNEFDKFLGDDMGNVKVDELTEKKVEERIVEIDSPFVSKVINNDLVNLESKLMSFSATKNAVIGLKDDLIQTLGFNIIDDASNDDIKSLLYISSTMYNYYVKNYIINSATPPQGLPPLKIKTTNKDHHLVELAKDILTFMGFYRTLRRKLETKFDDAYENKSIVYLALRSFMDVFCFSYLDGLKSEEVVSAVSMRFKYFEKLGVFKRYQQHLIDHNLTTIDINDVVSFAVDVSSKLNSNEMYITELHDKWKNDGLFKFSSVNNFTLEQIKNEIVFLEVNNMLGVDLKNPSQSKYLVDNGITDETLKEYLGVKNVKLQIKTEKITPIFRFIDKFKQDIPDRFREHVLDYIKEMKFNEFNFKETTWPLQEFDDRIVKALYCWKPSIDEKMKTNFEYFAACVENEQLSKDGILIVSKEERTDSQWDDVHEFI